MILFYVVAGTRLERATSGADMSPPLYPTKKENEL